MQIRKLPFLVVNLTAVIVVYIFIEHLCDSYKCYALESTITEPLFYGLAGLLFSAFLLQFYRESVFQSWVRKIASWYFPLTLIMVTMLEEGEGLFPMTSSGRVDTVILMMAILFVITLVYAVAMRNKLNA